MDLGPGLGSCSHLQGLMSLCEMDMMLPCRVDRTAWVITQAGAHKPRADSGARWWVQTQLCHLAAGDLGESPWSLGAPLLWRRLP